MEEDTILGFLEEEAPYLLQSRFFPSKAGGEPAWLLPAPLPCAESLRCEACGHAYSFFCQLSASRGDDDPSCFHRIVFVFICRNCKDKVKVLRSKLPRINSFYSFDPPDEEDETIDPRPNGEPHLGPSFAEFKIDSDGDAEEDLEEDSDDDEADQLDNRLAMEQYTAYRDRIEQNPDAELDASEVEFFDEWREKNYKSDDEFRKFQFVCKQNPTQVLRFGGAPLWFSNKSKCDKVPCCACGSQRSFEFQIMPQLIALLKADVEYGVIVVYTCDANCEGMYVDEFAHVQPEPQE